MSWEIQAARRIEALVRLSRLSDLGLLMSAAPEDRIDGIARALQQLPSGAYLLGCGPYNCGLFRLANDRTIIGREPWANETPPSEAPNIALRDGVTFGPREVSRLHACIERREIGGQSVDYVEDLGSTCGTFVNGARLTPGRDGAIPLADWDVISLGGSQTVPFVFLIAPQDR